MMTVAAPESRNRRQRWLKLTAVAAVILAIGGGGCAGSGGGTKEPSTTQVLKNGILTSVPNQTVVLLVDVSGSMRSTDVEPTRLDATAAAIKTFLAQLPERFEVGLVAFSSTAEVVQAPTRDRRLVLQAVDTLEPEAATALGDGLALAVRLTVATLARQGILRAPGHYLPAVIVLESDGAQNRGNLSAFEGAERAKAAGIRVDGVAVGTPEGKVEFGYGIYKTSVEVPPDPEAVEEIARITGGKSFTAETAARLQAIYSDLAASIAG